MRSAATILVALGCVASLVTATPCNDYDASAATGGHGPVWSMATLKASKDYEFIGNWKIGEQMSSSSEYANFTLNFCSNVHKKPDASCPDGNSMAYMTLRKGKASDGNPVKCYSVGSDFDKQSKPLPYSFQDHDTYKPAIGYNIRYLSTTSGGPSEIDCTDPTKTRSVELAMMCGDKPFPKPGSKTNTFVKFLEKGDYCTYELYIESHAGCPQECPLVNEQLCAGKGVCRYDTSINNARCFCDDGWIEADCTKPSNPLPGSAVAGAIFGGIFIGLFGVGGYWGYQIYRQRSAGGGAGGEDLTGYYDAPIDG